MGRPFLPAADNALQEWGLNFKTKITLSPVTYGLVAADATAFGVKQDAYTAALLLAQDPATRSPVNVAAKDYAKAELVEIARALGRKVQGAAGVTPAQKLSLGLCPRDAARTPNPAPTVAPNLIIESVTGRSVRVRLRDAENPDSRARPRGVAFATIMSHVGPTAPSELSEYTLEGNTTRNLFEVIFPDDVAPNAQVFLVAFWNSTRGQSGPACTPVATSLTFNALNTQSTVLHAPRKRAA